MINAFVTSKSPLIVMLAVLPDLPSVKLAKDELIFDEVNVKPLEKLVLAGSITKVPFPVYELDDKVGALFLITRLPALIVVEPVKVLVAVRVRVLELDFTNAPTPEMTCSKL